MFIPSAVILSNNNDPSASDSLESTYDFTRSAAVFTIILSANVIFGHGLAIAFQFVKWQSYNMCSDNCITGLLVLVSWEVDLPTIIAIAGFCKLVVKLNWQHCILCFQVACHGDTNKQTNKQTKGYFMVTMIVWCLVYIHF